MGWPSTIKDVVGEGDGFVGESADALDGDFARQRFVKCYDIAALGVAVVGESARGEDEIALEQEGLHAVTGDTESTGAEEVKEAGGVQPERESPGPQFSLLHDCMRLGII